jgi:hypothetical protein
LITLLAMYGSTRAVEGGMEYVAALRATRIL